MKHEKRVQGRSPRTITPPLWGRGWGGGKFRETHPIFDCRINTISSNFFQKHRKISKKLLLFLEESVIMYSDITYTSDNFRGVISDIKEENHSC